MFTFSIGSNILGLYVLMYVVWIITVISYRKNEIKGIKKKRDDYSLSIIRLNTIVSIVIVVGTSAEEITILPSWFFYLGLFFMILGFIIREWAIITIGRFFSSRVSIYKDHKLVNEGLYKFIRHPAYTGALFSIIGLGMAFRSLLGLLLLLVLIGLAYGYRIKKEENLLLGEFGDKYVDYMNKTKRLIPGFF